MAAPIGRIPCPLCAGTGRLVSARDLSTFRCVDCDGSGSAATPFGYGGPTSPTPATPEQIAAAAKRRDPRPAAAAPDARSFQQTVEVIGGHEIDQYPLRMRELSVSVRHEVTNESIRAEADPMRRAVQVVDRVRLDVAEAVAQVLEGQLPPRAAVIGIERTVYLDSGGALASLPEGERVAVLRQIGKAVRAFCPEAADYLESAGS